MAKPKKKLSVASSRMPVKTKKIVKASSGRQLVTGNRKLPKQLSFNKKAEAEFDDILNRYPDRRSAIMMTLYLAQEEFGWMSKPVMEFVAQKLEVPISQVWELVTFYTMYLRKQPGKFHLQVCKTLSCELGGSKNLIQFLKDKYKLKNGETTPDGLFTLTEVECLGACDKAPVMQVNHEYYENLDAAKLEKVLEVLKERI